jgi:hypothetical protein
VVVVVVIDVTLTRETAAEAGGREQGDENQTIPTHYVLLDSPGGRVTHVGRSSIKGSSRLSSLDKDTAGPTPPRNTF